MNTYLLVKGKKGVLVGDPDRAGRWAGQRKIKLEDPSKARGLRDHFEPCWTVHDYGHDLLKPKRNDELAELKKVQAESKSEALKQAPSDKPAAKKGSSK